MREIRMKRRKKMVVMSCPLHPSVPGSHSASPAKHDSEVAVADLVPECVVNAWMCPSSVQVWGQWNSSYFVPQLMEATPHLKAVGMTCDWAAWRVEAFREQKVLSVVKVWKCWQGFYSWVCDLLQTASPAAVVGVFHGRWAVQYKVNVYQRFIARMH